MSYSTRVVTIREEPCQSTYVVFARVRQSADGNVTVANGFDLLFVNKEKKVRRGRQTEIKHLYDTPNYTHLENATLLCDADEEDEEKQTISQLTQIHS